MRGGTLDSPSCFPHPSDTPVELNPLPGEANQMSAQRSAHVCSSRASCGASRQATAHFPQICALPPLTIAIAATIAGYPPRQTPGGRGSGNRSAQRAKPTTGESICCCAASTAAPSSRASRSRSARVGGKLFQPHAFSVLSLCGQLAGAPAEDTAWMPCDAEPPAEQARSEDAREQQLPFGRFDLCSRQKIRWRAWTG